MADREITIQINADISQAEGEVKKLEGELKSNPLKLEVDADIRKAKSDIESIKSLIQSLTRGKNGDIKLAVEGIDDLQSKFEQIGISLKNITTSLNIQNVAPLKVLRKEYEQLSESVSKFESEAGKESLKKLFDEFGSGTQAITSLQRSLSRGNFYKTIFNGDDLTQYGQKLSNILKNVNILVDNAQDLRKISIPGGNSLFDVVSKLQNMNVSGFTQFTESQLKGIEGIRDRMRELEIDMTRAQTREEGFKFNLDEKSISEMANAIAGLKQSLTDVNGEPLQIGLQAGDVEKITDAFTKLETVLTNIHDLMSTFDIPRIEKVVDVGTNQKQTQQREHSTQTTVQRTNKVTGDIVTTTTQDVTSKGSSALENLGNVGNNAGSQISAGMKEAAEAVKSLVELANSAANAIQGLGTSISNITGNKSREVLNAFRELDRKYAEGTDTEYGFSFDSRSGRASSFITGKDRRISGSQVADSINQLQGKADSFIHTHPDVDTAAFSLNEIKGLFSDYADGIKQQFVKANNEIAKLDVEKLVRSGIDKNDLVERATLEREKAILEYKNNNYDRFGLQNIIPENYTEILGNNIKQTLESSLKESGSSIEIGGLESLSNELLTNIVSNIKSRVEGKEVFDTGLVSEELDNALGNIIRSSLKNINIDNTEIIDTLKADVVGLIDDLIPKDLNQIGGLSLTKEEASRMNQIGLRRAIDSYGLNGSEVYKVTNENDLLTSMYENQIKFVATLDDSDLRSKLDDLSKERTIPIKIEPIGDLTQIKDALNTNNKAGVVDVDVTEKTENLSSANERLAETAREAVEAETKLNEVVNNDSNDNTIGVENTIHNAVKATDAIGEINANNIAPDIVNNTADAYNNLADSATKAREAINNVNTAGITGDKVSNIIPEDTTEKLASAYEQLNSLSNDYQTRYTQDPGFEREFDQNIQIAETLRNTLNEIFSIQPDTTVDSILQNLHSELDTVKASAEELNNTFSQIRTGTREWDFNKMLCDQTGFAQRLNELTGQYTTMLSTEGFDEKELLNIEARIQSMLQIQNHLFDYKGENAQVFRDIFSNIQSQLTSEAQRVQDEFWEAMANGGNLMSTNAFASLIEDRLHIPFEKTSLGLTSKANELEQLINLLQNAEQIMNNLSDQSKIDFYSKMQTDNFEDAKYLQKRLQSDYQEAYDANDIEWIENQYRYISEYLNKAEEYKSKIAEIKGEAYDAKIFTPEEIQQSFSSGELSNLISQQLEQEAQAIERVAEAQQHANEVASSGSSVSSKVGEYEQLAESANRATEAEANASKASKPVEIPQDVNGLVEQMTALAEQLNSQTQALQQQASEVQNIVSTEQESFGNLANTITEITEKYSQFSQEIAKITQTENTASTYQASPVENVEQLTTAYQTLSKAILEAQEAQSKLTSLSTETVDVEGTKSTVSYVSQFSELGTVISDIARDVNGLSAFISQVNEATSNNGISDYSQTVNSLSNALVNLKDEDITRINDLSGKLAQFASITPESISGVLNSINVSPTASENIELLATAFDRLKTALSGFSGDSNFASTIQPLTELLSRSTQLQNLADILKESESKIKAVKEKVGTSETDISDRQAEEYKTLTDAVNKYAEAKNVLDSGARTVSEEQVAEYKKAIEIQEEYISKIGLYNEKMQEASMKPISTQNLKDVQTAESVLSKVYSYLDENQNVSGFESQFQNLRQQADTLKEVVISVRDNISEISSDNLKQLSSDLSQVFSQTSSTISKELKARETSSAKALKETGIDSALENAKEVVESNSQSMFQPMVDQLALVNEKIKETENLLNTLDLKNLSDIDISNIKAKAEELRNLYSQAQSTELLPADAEHKANAISSIEDWLNKNTQAANSYIERMEALKIVIQEAQNQMQIENAENEFSQIQSQYSNDEETKLLALKEEKYKELADAVKKYVDAREQIAKGNRSGNMTNELAERYKNEYQKMAADLFKNSRLYDKELEDKALKPVLSGNFEQYISELEEATTATEKYKQAQSVLQKADSFLAKNERYNGYDGISESLENVKNKAEEVREVLSKIEKGELTGTALGNLNNELSNALNTANNQVSQIVRMRRLESNVEVRNTGLTSIYNRAQRFSFANAQTESESFRNSINDLNEQLRTTDELTSHIDINNLTPDDLTQLRQQAIALNNALLNAQNAQPVNPLKQASSIRTFDQWLSRNGVVIQKYGDEVDFLRDKLKNASTALDLDDANTQIQKFMARVTEAGDIGLTFGEKLQRSFSSLGRYLMSYVSFYRIIGTIKEGINIVSQFDKAMTSIKMVSNETAKTYENMHKASFNIAQEIGGDALSIQESMGTWLRLGKSIEESQEAAKASSWLVNVSEFDNIKEASTALVSIKQAYDDLSYEDILDKLNAVGDSFSSSTDALASGLQNSAAALVTQGNDINEALALLTAGNDITQDISKASAGIRTISLRIAGTEEAKQEIKDMGEDIDDFVVRTQSKTDKIIRDYTAVASNNYQGVSVLNDSGNLRSTYDIKKCVHM